MTMKSAFYPIIKEKIYSWIGDMIDVLSVATTLFGVCTSLGLGVTQLNAGLNRLNPDIGVNDDTQTAIIWVITLMATISVVSGVQMGIRRISEVNFSLGQILMFVMMFQEDTWYLLNATVQSIGFYLQVRRTCLTMSPFYNVSRLVFACCCCMRVWQTGSCDQSVRTCSESVLARGTCILTSAELWACSVAERCRTGDTH